MAEHDINMADWDDHIIEMAEQDHRRQYIKEQAAKLEQSNVKRFLSKKKRTIHSKHAGQEPTHVLLDSGRSMGLYAGKVAVAEFDMDGLYQSMICDMDKGVMHPLVECFANTVRFAMDWDLKTPASLSDDQKLQFATTAHNAVRELLLPLEGTSTTETDDIMSSAYTSIVCSVVGPERKVEKDGHSLIKDGIHQIWPALVVNHQQARFIISHVAAAMEKEHPRDDIVWAKVLDNSIYSKGHGLRLCYTVKRELCVPCKTLSRSYNKRREKCDACTGKWGQPCDTCKPEEAQNPDCTLCMGSSIDYSTQTPHYYAPTSVLQPDGDVHKAKTEQLVNDKMAALRSTSVAPPASFVPYQWPAEVGSNKRRAAAPTSSASKRTRTVATEGVESILLQLLKDGVGDTTSEIDLASRTELSAGVFSYRFTRTSSSRCVYGEEHERNGGYLQIDTTTAAPVVRYVCLSERCGSGQRSGNLECEQLAVQWKSLEVPAADVCQFNMAALRTSATAATTCTHTTVESHGVVHHTSDTSSSTTEVRAFADDADNSEAEGDDDDDDDDDDDEFWTKSITFKGWVKGFNKRHFMANEGASFGTINSDNSVTISNQISKFVTRYSHYGRTAVRTEGCKNPQSMLKVKAWMEHPNVRRYRRVRMAPPPQVCEHDTFNTWRGFAVERLRDQVSSGVITVDAADVERVLLHIRILCNHEPAVVEWFLNWLAQLFQQPGVIPKVAPIFHGKQQAGKGFFFNDFLQYVIGKEHYWSVQNPKLLLGDFNSQLELKLFVNVDEQEEKNGKRYEQAIKKLITDPGYNSVSKGVDGREATHCARFVFTSNADTPCQVTAGTMRLCPIQTSPEKIGDAAYFRELSVVCAKPGTRWGFYDFLKQRDISGVHLQSSRPITASYLTMQEETIDPIIKMMFSFSEGTLGHSGPYGEWYHRAVEGKAILDARAQKTPKVSVDMLFELYKVYWNEWFANNRSFKSVEQCDSLPLPNISKMQFAKAMRKLAEDRCPVPGSDMLQSGVTAVRMTGGCSAYTVDRTQLSKFMVAQYRFKSQLGCMLEYAFLPIASLQQTQQADEQNETESSN
jgi:Family of unknown function (DUF5906)